MFKVRGGLHYHKIVYEFINLINSTLVAKNRTFIFFLIFILSRAAICQPWYFNQIYNPDETWACGMSIIGTPNGYFGCAISGDSVSDYFYNACTFLLDDTGDLVSWKNFGEYGYDYYPGYYGSLNQFQDSCYALFGGRHNLFTGHHEGIFFKLNSLGDTIFTRIFNSDSYNNFVGRTCTVTFDEGFALLGEVSVNSDYSDVVLIKTDSQANEIWRSQFGSEIDDWGVSIAQTADSGYILGTWAYIPVQIVTADPIVIKTDSQGNFEWSLNLGGPYGDDKAMVCNTQDSCIMVLTAYADSMYTPEHAYAKINLVKMDMEGNIIWNKKYGPSKRVNYISNLISLVNGDLVACGYCKYSSYLDPVGWLFRFNSAGDSLWYREYFYYPENPNYSINFLYDVSRSSDNGFVAAGQAFTLSPPNNIQKMWVLKVDSIGCEIPNCWVGIEEDDKTVRRYDDKKGGLEVWPNPASEILNFKFSILNSGSNNSITVYDIFGREVTEIIVPDKQDQIQFNVESYPPGVYIVILRNGNVLVESRKFVVAR